MNMTEEQLSCSTADISTNEYFMLAQSVASDEQKAEYDALLEKLDANRASKQRAQDVARQNAIDAAKREQTVERRGSVARTTIVSVSAALSFGLFFLASILMLSDVESAGAYYTASLVFRIVCDSVSMRVKNEKLSILNIFGLIATGFTAFAIIICFISGEGSFVNIGLIVASFIVGSMAISRHKPKKK